MRLYCETSMKQTSEHRKRTSRFWCNSPQDVGTHDCRSLGHTLHTAHNARCSFKWMYLLHTGSIAAGTMYIRVRLARLSHFAIALKWKNDMVSNSLIIFPLNMHFIVYFIHFNSLPNELEQTKEDEEEKQMRMCNWMRDARVCTADIDGLSWDVRRRIKTFFRFKF